MNSPTRLLSCVLAIIALPAQGAAPARPDRPRSIQVFVDDSGGITVDNGSSKSPDRTKVWARAGGNVAFVIENLDRVAHDVRIPIAQVLPSPKHGGDATPNPIAPQTDSLTIAAGEVGVLVFRVRPLAHFGFDTRERWKKDRSLGMTYKYNIYTRPAGAKDEILHDPDIEIIRP